jgi:hypothetical protein
MPWSRPGRLAWCRTRCARRNAGRAALMPSPPGRQHATAQIHTRPRTPAGRPSSRSIILIGFLTTIQYHRTQPGTPGQPHPAAAPLRKRPSARPSARLTAPLSRPASHPHRSMPPTRTATAASPPRRRELPAIGALPVRQMRLRPLAAVLPQVSLSCRRLAWPAAIPGRYPPSSLPPLFARGRGTTGFLPSGHAVQACPDTHRQAAQ